MEPGRDDREDAGNGRPDLVLAQAAMEPGRDDREDAHLGGPAVRRCRAAMEPGRDDREDHPMRFGARCRNCPPQWSPVVMTGKTRAGARSTAT